MLRDYRQDLLNYGRHSLIQKDRVATGKTLRSLRAFQYKTVDNKHEHIILSGGKHILDLVSGDTKKFVNYRSLKDWADARGLDFKNLYSVKLKIEKNGHKTPPSKDLLSYPTQLFYTHQKGKIKIDALNHLVKTIKWK